VLFTGAVTIAFTRILLLMKEQRGLSEMLEYLFAIAYPRKLAFGFKMNVETAQGREEAGCRTSPAADGRNL
jgi:hypothetical protein